MSDIYTPSQEEIAAFIERIWDEFISDADALISIDSSFDPDHACSGAPFGMGPRDALDMILRISERLGFEVNDGDGYAGWALAVGETGQEIGVIGHVDVVPAGEGWTFDPFSLTVKDGVLLGRGTSDDKVPLLCALYACAYWFEKGVSLKHDVRFIFGCNEETGMQDVPYYLAHHRAPDFLFTPDADFPLGYGEKGLFGVTIKHNIDLSEEESIVRSFDGGTATNAVPALAQAVLNISPDLLQPWDSISIEPCEEGTRVIARGISGHASTPEGTRNAIGVLAQYIADLPECSEQERNWLLFAARDLVDYTGSSLGVASRDDDFGSLTSVLGTMHKSGNSYIATIDIRFPAAITGTDLEKAFSALAVKEDLEIAITRNQEPFVVNPKTKPVEALMGAYRNATGLEVHPFTMGGATYAREFPNAVSFGPADPTVISKPEWVGDMHGADEGMTIEAIRHAIAIYIHAFGALAQVPRLS